MSLMLTHSQSVCAAVAGLGENNAFGFAAAICQRAVPIVVDGLQNRSTAQLTKFGSIWEGVWRFLVNLDDYPDSASTVFEEIIPSESQAAQDNEFFRATTMFYSLGFAIERNSPDDAIYISDAALALLDNLLYRQIQVPPTSGSDHMIDKHPLVIQEIERQNRDLRICKDIKPSERANWELWVTSSKETLLSQGKQGLSLTN